MDKLYVNVYGVTRCYGGPEEGGWFYNQSYPLASVPFKAERRPGHKPGRCAHCDEERQKEYLADFEGEKYTPSYCEEPKSNEAVDFAFDEWAYDYDANGNRKFPIDKIRELARLYRSNPDAEELTEFYESRFFKVLLQTVTHLVPADEAKKESIIADMKDLYAEEKRGNIYSVLGGQDVSIVVEEEPGKLDPETKPRYE